MEIKIKIEATGLEKAINDLAKAIAGAGITQIQPIVEAATEAAVTEKPVKTEEKKTEKPAEEKQPPKETEKKEDAAPKITLETVRVKLAELSQGGKQEEARALIAEFDSSDRPKLSNVSEDDYAELLEKAADL